MGTCDLKLNGFERKYELNISTYQMIILLLFNESNELTFGDILKLTNIPPEFIKRNLLALCVKSKTHEKILNKEETKKIDKNTKFSSNDKFKSKLIKIKVLPIVLKETKEEVEKTKEKVDEERKWILDASVVRIMKSRKTLNHQELIIEVTKQLSQRFLPAPDLIKKRIESLIEREYLERSKEDKNIYNYMA